MQNQHNILLLFSSSKKEAKGQSPHQHSVKANEKSLLFYGGEYLSFHLHVTLYLSLVIKQALYVEYHQLIC